MDRDKQIPCGNDRQKKQEQKQVLRCAQNDKVVDDKKSKSESGFFAAFRMTNLWWGKQQIP
jgi:hypothetical protein